MVGKTCWYLDCMGNPFLYEDYQDSKYEELTEKIIRAFYGVYNRFDYGFREKIFSGFSELVKFEISLGRV